MTPHLKQSRIAKALTDRTSGEVSFDAAEARLNKIRVTVVLGPDQARTAAGQAAALTAVNASFKCFGNVALVTDPHIRLMKRLPLGNTVGIAATTMGAIVVPAVPQDTTHVIKIGNSANVGADIFVRCWWNGWIAGVVPVWDDRALGSSGNPLAGIFAGALAVREVFATVLGYPRSGSRVSITSLWEPCADPDADNFGPSQVYLPPRLWFIGLGHLGQGFLWSLGFLPAVGSNITLQDDQDAGEENEATGLLTRGNDITRKKTRIAADWLDGLGWPTSLIERRHYGDIPLLENDPPIVITGLDEPKARIDIAGAGFEYLIDAGIGHGAVDFEGLQIRVLRKGANAAELWSSPDRKADIDALMRRDAYQRHLEKFEKCGALSLASASVAVPFVGAAVGALTIATAIRLASLKPTSKIMQMELGSPAMVLSGAINYAAISSLGSIAVDLS